MAMPARKMLKQKCKRDWEKKKEVMYLNVFGLMYRVGAVVIALVAVLNLLIAVIDTSVMFFVATVILSIIVWFLWSKSNDCYNYKHDPLTGQDMR